MSETKFLLVSIVPHNKLQSQILQELQETLLLIETYGGHLVDVVLQKREIHTKGSYIGTGKLQEVAQIIQEKKIDVVVLNAIIKPGQLYDFHTFLEKSNRSIEVWDRVDLILKIFAKTANTSEARLQIELAAMYHMGPRIYGMGDEMSRQGGMVGTRGIGETNTERMKRHWRNQIKKTKQDLEKLAQNRQQLIEQRHEQGFKTISLIGYTNAGKTSLFNLLTGKQKQVKDALFVTLDSTVGKLKHSKQPLLVSDTIGFISHLPPQLIEAFKSTLMESIYADLLIHVIDLSDEYMSAKIEEVQTILISLDLQDKKQLFVFNKTDLVNGIDKDQIIQKYQSFHPICISTKTKQGSDELLTHIENLVLNH